MPKYIEVAVNVPRVAGVFHYHLPNELEASVKEGSLLIVPFGTRVVYGVGLRFVDEPAVEETKAVIGLLDPKIALTKQQIQLAYWLSENTLSPLAACIGLMVPAGLMQMADNLYEILAAEEPPDLKPMQQRVYHLLKKRGPLRGKQIKRSFPKYEWQPAAEQLVKKGILKKTSLLPSPKVRAKKIRTVQLIPQNEEIETVLNKLGKQGSPAFARRKKIMEFLMKEPGPVDVSWVYAASGGNSADLRTLNAKGLIWLGETEVWRDPVREYNLQPYIEPELTKEQKAVWERIQKGLLASQRGEAFKPVLLHGVTGSGKTEIYLRAVKQVLEAGKQAIILVPEIALTPQTVKRFAGRFPGQVGLIHSQLSLGERYDTWRRAYYGELDIVVGPRSALFTPFHNLGLIVLDESHDDSYYQWDMRPHYDAKSAAVAYAQLTNAVVLMGTATPDVRSIYKCQQKEWHYLALPERILAHKKTIEMYHERMGIESTRYQELEAMAVYTELPPVDVIDMRTELKLGNRSIFSMRLQNQLREVLEKKQQAILFLNRRGSATYVFCRDCGYTMKCPRCDIPLAYHRDSKLLVCHHCNYKRKMPKVCPNCGSKRIRQYGTGTQRVETEVQRLFPEANTLRWDWETTRKKGAHQNILNLFTSHTADILIGTQMLAKGMDLPLVTLIGVILADVGLNLPDYRAGERTFQVLMQVAGRAGRSPLGGRVILQTFDPDHYVIVNASRHNYKGFFNQEIQYRRELGYPPFTQLVRLEYRHLNNQHAQEVAEKMGRQIKHWLEIENRRATRMIGPVPCFYEKERGEYRWQIVLSGPNPISLLGEKPLGDWDVEVNPPSLL